MKPPRIPPKEMRFLTADDVTLLADTHSDWWRTLVYTAAFAGLRWSELVGLTRKRADLPHRKIIVAEQYIRLMHGTFVWQEPKSRMGTRAVSMVGIPDSTSFAEGAHPKAIQARMGHASVQTLR